MTCDAVVLTRLEWDRLVSCGWLRLHNARLARVDDWSLPNTQLYFDALMETAPDVGTSSSDYVLAEIHYKIWPLISTHDFQLGQMLKLDQVQRFSCFDQRAYQVLNGTYNGPPEYAVQLFQAPQLWIEWRKRLLDASKKNRAARLLKHFDLQSPSLEEFKQESALFFDNLIDTQRSLSGKTIYEHAKGTRAFGWVVALAISKQNYTTEADDNVKLIVKNLQPDHHVDTPFFSGQSEDISNAIFKDPQYKKIYKNLIVCAAYAHYAYLIDRSGFKKFSYEAFCKDVTWLHERHTDLATQLVDKIARYMVDELLWQVISQHPKLPAWPTPVASENGPVPHTALGSDSTIEKETLPANAIAPTPEKIAPPASADRPSEKPEQRTEAIETVANDPGAQGSTATVDEGVTQRSLLPEEPKNPNSPQNLLAETPLRKSKRKFDLDFKKKIVQKVREQEIKQVCKEENLKKAQVKGWVKELDPELAKQL